VELVLQNITRAFGRELIFSPSLGWMNHFLLLFFFVTKILLSIFPRETKEARNKAEERAIKRLSIIERRSERER